MIFYTYPWWHIFAESRKKKKNYLASDSNKHHLRKNYFCLRFEMRRTRCVKTRLTLRVKIRVFIAVTRIEYRWLWLVVAHPRKHVNRRTICKYSRPRCGNSITAYANAAERRRANRIMRQVSHDHDRTRDRIFLRQKRVFSYTMVTFSFRGKRALRNARAYGNPLRRFSRCS
jgi:hypothetical protein